MNMLEIRELANRTVRQLNQDIGVVTMFNNRFTNRLGDATYIRVSNSGILRFSRKLWDYASPDERRECVIHEACHLVAEKISPNETRDGHGPTWQSLMRIMGLQPKRYHKVKVDGLRKPVDRYIIPCLCGGCKITKTRLTKMQRGVRYKCGKCFEILNPEKARLL